MRIGSFWGLPAPMFVLAQENRETGSELLRAFTKTSSEEQLSDLRKEFTQLLKIKSLVLYKNKVNVSAEMKDFYWRDGGVVEDSSMTHALIREITERVLAATLNSEQKGLVRDITDLESVIVSELDKKSFQICDTEKVTREILKSFPKASKTNANKWMDKYLLELSIVDSIVVDGAVIKLTEDDKKVISYYLSRLDDVEAWEKQLQPSNLSDDVIFGVPFTSLVARNPKSIQYSVLALFEPIKNSSNAKILRDIIASIKEDSRKFKENYRQFVSVLGKDDVITNKESIDDPDNFFECAYLRNAGFSWNSIPNSDKKLLIKLYSCIKKLTPECMAQKLGITTRDFTRYGKELCRFGICGINDCSEELFMDAILSTVLSVNKIYRSEETIQMVEDIMTNYVDALVDTILPVGERLL